MVSFRRLSDKTVAKYLELEKTGSLTPRQLSALRSHRAIVRWGELMDSRNLANLNGVQRASIATAVAAKEELP